MIIDEPRPRCLGCGKPLKRSTYFRNFYNLLPDGKEYPTTILECQSLVEPGHHIYRFNYIRKAIRDDLGHIIDHGDAWYFYGANVWNGSYGTFGKCGKCLPYDKSIAYGKKLKLLPAPVETPAPVTGTIFVGSAAMVLRSGAKRVASVFSGLRARVGRAKASPASDLSLPDLSAESASGSYPLPANAAEARFLVAPVFEATNAEIILMWRAFAHQRNEYASMLDDDPTNPHARERYDMLKGCMLKMRAQAEARRISVDFSPPEIIKFSGLEWHDLGSEYEPEDEPGFGGFEPSRKGVEPGRDDF